MYKEIDRLLKEEFIHWLNENDVMVEIIKELTKTNENKGVTSSHVFLWAKQVEALRTQTGVFKMETRNLMSYYQKGRKDKVINCKIANKHLQIL